MENGIAVYVAFGKFNDKQISIVAEDRDKFAVVYQAISKFATTIARDSIEKTTTSVLVNETFLPDIEAAAGYLMENKLKDPKLAKYSLLIDSFFRLVNEARNYLNGMTSTHQPRPF